MSLFSFFRKKKYNEATSDIEELNSGEVCEQVEDILENEDTASLQKEQLAANEMLINSITEKLKALQDYANKLEDEVLEDYDPKKDLSHYTFPTVSLLKIHDQAEIYPNKIEKAKDEIIAICLANNVHITAIKATVSAISILYEIIIKSGTRITTVMRLREDLAFALSSPNLRIETIIEKGTIGIIVPSDSPQILSLHSIISSRKFQECEYELPIILGKNIFNENLSLDLTESPHLLVAGATGQGKSVLLNTMILSLLYKKHPAELKLVLIDTQKIEFNPYSIIEKHFLAKSPSVENAIVSSITDSARTLSSLCLEMDERYSLFVKAGTRNVKEYNNHFKKRKLSPRSGHKYLPYIVVVIDEYADLSMTAGKDVELPLIRLTQKAHYVGIHIILSTQRPTQNIITGSLKANFPIQIAFKVASASDSRIIIDKNGAESLSIPGEALYNDSIHTKRIHVAYTDTYDVTNLSLFIGEQQGYSSAFELPEYISPYDNSIIASVDLNELDPLLEEAARLVVIYQSGSTSLIQRKFSIGYNRAGRIMDQLEVHGIIGVAQGSKPRDVLITDEYSLEQKLGSFR